MLTMASLFPSHVLGEVPVLSRPACRRPIPAVLFLLQSGQVRYKAVDSFYRTDRVSNCIHAVGGAADGHRVLSPGWGETASFVLLRRFSPWIVDPCQTYPWVGRALGLDGYPLIYRD